jgi:hypothetical protein
MGLAEDMIRLAEAGIDDALIKAANDFAAIAKRNMPVGDPTEDPSPQTSMREHVHVRPDRDGVIVSVETAYAAKQEFDLRLKHPRGGGPRFLQRALAEVLPHLDGVVASEVEARFAAGLPRKGR